MQLPIVGRQIEHSNNIALSCYVRLKVNKRNVLLISLRGDECQPQVQYEGRWNIPFNVCVGVKPMYYRCVTFLCICCHCHVQIYCQCHIQTYNVSTCMSSQLHVHICWMFDVHTCITYLQQKQILSNICDFLLSARYF